MKWGKQQQILINKAKQNCPDQNAINLCKEPSHVPSPSDINWDKLKQDFYSTVSKFRKHYKQSQFNTFKNKNKEHLKLY